MTTRVEESVKFVGAANEVLEDLCVLPDGFVLGEEVYTAGVFLGSFDGARVDRGLAALGGNDDNFGLRGKDIVGVSELGLDLLRLN